MKTKQLKKIYTLASIFLLILVSSPVFSQGAPTNPDGSGYDSNNNPVDTNNVNDEVPPAPIDQDIWLGLVGGCLLGVYFFIGKQKNVLTK